MRILVVDDHLPTLELMRLTLTSFGHIVSTTTTVANALDLLAADAPDVILSDLTFPSVAGQHDDEQREQQQDGHALARAVRSQPGNERIGLIAITGVASPTERQAALHSGFDEVVVKPFDLESLMERIDALSGQ